MSKRAAVAGAALFFSVLAAPAMASAQTTPPTTDGTSVDSVVESVIPGNQDSDSDKTGLWGLLGLAGLAGLAGLKRRTSPTTPAPRTTSTPPVGATQPD